MLKELEQQGRPEPAEDGFVKLVRSVVAEVLETMFFAEAVPSECGHSWMGAAVSARVPFEGSHSGEMRLDVSGEAADAVASAFLGADPGELSEAARTQVMLELANILCGAILSHLWPESKLALASPELASDAANTDYQLHNCFELIDGRLAVGIRWSEAAGPS